MAARLRSFHITPRFEQAEDWFFMRPQESFDQIERRLTDSEDEEEDIADVDVAPVEGETMTLSPELTELIAEQKKAFGPLIRQPRNDMQVVVWTPRTDFVQEVVNKSLGPRITELEHDDEEVEDDDAISQTHFVTFPDAEDTDSADVSVRRRRKSPLRPERQRCSSTFVIQELSDANDLNEMECD